MRTETEEDLFITLTRIYIPRRYYFYRFLCMYQLALILLYWLLVYWPWRRSWRWRRYNHDIQKIRFSLFFIFPNEIDRYIHGVLWYACAFKDWKRKVGILWFVSTKYFWVIELCFFLLTTSATIGLTFMWWHLILGGVSHSPIFSLTTCLYTVVYFDKDIK